MAAVVVYCAVHLTPMNESTGWYGTKWECKRCLAENHTPNGKRA